MLKLKKSRTTTTTKERNLHLRKRWQ